MSICTAIYLLLFLFIQTRSQNLSNVTTSPPNDEPTDKVIRDWEIILVSLNGVVVLGIAVACCCFGSVTIWRKRQTKFQPLKSQDEEARCVTGRLTGKLGSALYCDIVIEDLVGRGMFTMVHKARLDYQNFAIKTRQDNRSELGSTELITEIERYRSIQLRTPDGHPNILEFYAGSLADPLYLCIAIMPCGSLDNYLRALRVGPIPKWYLEFAKNTIEEGYCDYVSGTLMYVILQVCRGMSFLSHYGITHRDLSPRNVFLTENLEAKIGNFGVPLEGKYYQVTERAGYIEDMAPENMQVKRFSVKSDVWSFGILTYKVCTLGLPPFPDIAPHDLYREIGAGKRPNVLGCCDNNMFFLLQKCWQHSPNERPYFHSILTELEKMIEDPSRYIHFKVMEIEGKPGHSDSGGVAYLFRPPVELLDGSALVKAKRTPLLQEWRSKKRLQIRLHEDKAGTSTAPNPDSPLGSPVTSPQLSPSGHMGDVYKMAVQAGTEEVDYERSDPDGKDLERLSNRKQRNAARHIPTLEGTRASMGPSPGIYLPSLEESQLVDTGSDELDISILARDRMPLTHAASNLSIYTIESQGTEETSNDKTPFIISKDTELLTNKV